MDASTERTGGLDDERIRLGGGRRRPIGGDGMREGKRGHRCAGAVAPAAATSRGPGSQGWRAQLRGDVTTVLSAGAWPKVGRALVHSGRCQAGSGPASTPVAASHGNDRSCVLTSLAGVYCRLWLAFSSVSHPPACMCCSIRRGDAGAEVQ